MVHHNSLLNFSRSWSEEEQLFGFTCFTFPSTLPDIVTLGNIIISISSVFRIKCFSIKLEGASDQVVTLSYAIFPGLPPINTTFKHFWVSSLSFPLFWSVVMSLRHILQSFFCKSIEICNLRYLCISVKGGRFEKWFLFEKQVFVEPTTSVMRSLTAKENIGNFFCLFQLFLFIVKLSLRLCLCKVYKARLEIQYPFQHGFWETGNLINRQKQLKSGLF